MPDYIPQYGRSHHYASKCPPGVIWFYQAGFSKDAERLLEFAKTRCNLYRPEMNLRAVRVTEIGIVEELTGDARPYYDPSYYAVVYDAPVAEPDRISVSELTAAIDALDPDGESCSEDSEINSAYYSGYKSAVAAVRRILPNLPKS